ncbi:dihydrolipoamide S-acyltransferase [Natronomonas pharaonis DSM 2160]|uniref:Dihydrolipoamide S-acyltransferase n=1 Tax=Natronomonas pharaonis (strain ATCC 35678 / DSM 2160 / CIP 103997 / JCM 8858 / NBRC 14720 / NCIMB 2260 / Gabara) TaxID=348780 RepID=A0A1U7ETW6_NATPD|nr:dihydrolipoamide acetyltransferase family protein [Natronomonas pharaonis]CAI48369.1 dihydrolipoamide S-acyltransferase [Natronomonas pharaonis DSM 2160]
MAHEFELPDVGEGLTEAEIVRWLVEPGETVTEDQPVAEVETDKAVVEVPAPVNGTVAELRAEEGEMVSVGTVIITFDVDGDSDATDDEGEPADKATTDEAATEDDDSTTDAAPTGADGRVFAAPSTRRLARELGVDIAAVDGSGPGGRVTEADVRAAADATDTVESGADDAPPSGDDADTDDTDDDVRSAVRRVDEEADDGGSDATPDEKPTAAEAADRDRTLAAPATRKLADESGVDLDAVPTDETRDGEAFVTPEQVQQYAEAQTEAQAADTAAVADTTADTAGDERIPYRGIRRTIGERMAESKRTVPHATHHDEVDVTRLVEIRDRLSDRAEARDTKLTYMPFVLKAVVAGLQEHPVLNAQLDEDAEEIVLRSDYNVGVATATDAGLMVPVVDDVDRKGLLAIADEMRDLVSKARERSIAPEEMQGGTFTVTNFGAVGGEYATPIINYPEAAILGLGEIKRKPRVVDDEIVPRDVLTLSLSIDHRVIDGAEAASFVNTVSAYLEDPELLLLE